MTGTFGPAYDEDLDGARIHQQMVRVRACMIDGQWRTLPEIRAQTGDPEASISAQLRHLRKRRFGSYIVEKRRRGAGRRGLWEYRVLPPATVAATVVEQLRPEHGLSEDGGAFYTWVGPGLVWPHFVCSCGFKCRGANWEEAGAEFDEHLRKNEAG